MCTVATKTQEQSQQEADQAPQGSTKLQLFSSGEFGLLSLLGLIPSYNKHEYSITILRGSPAHEDIH